MAIGYRGDPIATELPLILLTPALFAANMAAARWAESAAVTPVFLPLADGSWPFCSCFRRSHHAYGLGAMCSWPIGRGSFCLRDLEWE
jgi:hypothetical protein